MLPLVSPKKVAQKGGTLTDTLSTMLGDPMSSGARILVLIESDGSCYSSVKHLLPVNRLGRRSIDKPDSTRAF